ncbi:ankyrin repeat domain-containing protein [Salinivibrio sp. MA440]|uniref:ankyrin repeat domain-containing protein n=1 Tax=Salinivibrio sp. MA440 TaxID=1909456 RepID=UPI001F527C53|nr:ankyrin repeat domain-containing protein [Salinivibrio sp. MA440]
MLKVTAIGIGIVFLLWVAKAGAFNLFRSKPYPEVFFEGELLAVAEAMKARDIDKAKALAEKLPDIDAPGNEHFTLLAFAVADTNVPAINMLMALGADPAAKIDDAVIADTDVSETVAHLAMRLKTTEPLRAMLEAGMDTEIKRGSGTLIFDVPDLEDNDALKLLVEFGADVNARTGVGKTPLLDFIRVNMDEVLYLLESGADPFVIDNGGLSAAYSVQQSLDSMDKSIDAYQKMQNIQQKMIALGVQFPALTPYGERFRNNIVYCVKPRGYRPREECEEEGTHPYLKPQSDASKRQDEKILRERYGIDAKL